MSLFYLLPPRPVVGERLAVMLQNALPGLTGNRQLRDQLTEAFTATLQNNPDVFVVHREDLPIGQSLDQAIRDTCGAEAGDEVVEFRPAIGAPGFSASHWHIG